MVRVPCETIFFFMRSHSSSEAQNLGSTNYNSILKFSREGAYCLMRHFWMRPKKATSISWSFCEMSSISNTLHQSSQPPRNVRTMPPSYSWPRFLSWSWLPCVSYPLLPGLQKYIISLDPLWNIWRWSYPFPHFLFSKITVLIFYHHCFSDF